MRSPDYPEQAICVDTWREKYKYRDEPDYNATCARVAGALCADEPEEFHAEVLRAMQAREIVPAGRIMAGAGTDKRVTLINCFVSPDIQDSMRTEPELPGKGIMEALVDAAYTQQMGGGIGMDFSTIRPRGAMVHRTGSISSGVLPFMDMWDAMCATIRSAGSRRGAMMATLGIWHPDIEEFIEAKRRPGRLTNFNVSVLVTDEFMDAVKNDLGWSLRFPARPAVPFGRTESMEGGGYIYRRIGARELWDKIIGNTYIHAEPGVLFIDRINQQNNLAYCEQIHCVNPCGEQCLPANGDCNLGHTNLGAMVDNPFARHPHPTFDFDKLRRSARLMVRLLDNVLDKTLWPTKEQEAEAMAKRRIGLGFTGLGTALQYMNIPYGSAEAIEFTRMVAAEQAVAAYTESISLAKERGPFPAYDKAGFRRAPFVAKVLAHCTKDNRYPNERHLLKRYGIRNGVLLSIAPVGTMTLAATGNGSSGIEPVFAHRARRNVRGDSGEMSNQYSVFDAGFLRYCRSVNLDPDDVATDPAYKLPAGFVTADQLSVEQHLQMTAAAQEWVDSAISKTINCPESMALEEFKAVYSRAYALGMKGCTTYRPDLRSGRGAVLEVQPAAAVVPAPPSPEALIREQSGSEGGIPLLIMPPDRDKAPMQDVADGRRYRIKWPSEDCAYYVIITDYIDAQGRRRPFELFISTKSERHSEWVKAFSLMVTAIFRREGDPSFVVDELKTVFAATGGTWMKVPWSDKPKLAPSLVAAIGLKIEGHLRDLGMIAADVMIAPAPAQVQAESMPAAELLDVCYGCGARAVIYSEGCATCHACGKSDCG